MDCKLLVSWDLGFSKSHPQVATPPSTQPRVTVNCRSLAMPESHPTKPQTLETIEDTIIHS